jgi:hypothetical protein
MIVLVALVVLVAPVTVIASFTPVGQIPAPTQGTQDFILKTPLLYGGCIVALDIVVEYGGLPE